MLNTPINFLEKLSQFQDQWSPKVIAELNDYQCPREIAIPEYEYIERVSTQSKWLMSYLEQ
jgi:hypothetical protein